MSIAIVLAVLLLVALGVIAWQYDPRKIGSTPPKRLGLPPSHLPSAA